MTSLFKVYRLNASGMAKAQEIQTIFETTYYDLHKLCDPNSREFAVMKTKLEEACFFAKKAMAIQHENQDQ